MTDHIAHGVIVEIVTGQSAVFGITLQQALSLQIPTDAVASAQHWSAPWPSESATGHRAAQHIRHRETACGLFSGALAITVVLIEVNHPQSVIPWRDSLRLSGLLMLQAAPLMLIFFVLSPRIPGPLWGFPSDTGASMTGLSDSMEPGSINALGLPDEVAFRVRFDSTVPERRQMY